MRGEGVLENQVVGLIPRVGLLKEASRVIDQSLTLRAQALLRALPCRVRSQRQQTVMVLLDRYLDLQYVEWMYLVRKAVEKKNPP